MTKLSDTQLIVLSSAAKHDEGLATRPANLNAAAATKVASSLIDKGLARMRGFHTAPRVPRDLDKMPPLAHASIPRANIVLSIVGTIAPTVRVRRNDNARAGACGM